MKSLFAKISRKLINNQRASKPLLESLPRIFCDTSSLGYYDQAWINETLHCQRIDREWSQDVSRIDSLQLPDMAGGVNQGDRRALYYLVRRLKPCKFLEIGTHIGSSTIALALAAARNQSDGVDTRIVTVDIRDVNNEHTKPWLEVCAPDAPAHLLRKLDLHHLVTFEVNTAVKKLGSLNDLYDVIFLDGDHSATAVYQEIPLALKRLGANGQGTIILHDYFRGLQPLWSGQDPLPGPFQAVERFLSEGTGFCAMPLGKLPWPTKLGSNATSLALLSKNT